VQVCGLSLHASLPYFVSTNRPVARPLFRRALGILFCPSAAWLIGTLVWRNLGLAAWLTAMPIARCVAAALILVVIAVGLEEPDSRTVAVMACSAAASVVTGMALWRGLPRNDGPVALPRLRRELG